MLADTLKLALITSAFRRSDPSLKVESYLVFADNSAATVVNGQGWASLAAKEFGITEKIKLTFRTDAFNVLNHPVFAVPIDPNTLVANFNINDTRFGQSTRTVSEPRRLQMSLVLTF